MPNINKQITLTSKENSAGPYFDVYYSTDCVSYTICIDGSGVYLPNINSTAIVTVPDNTICIKLINKNANCGNNDYVDAFGTTTTTTTTAAPTTTSTTTLGPTTTTTTNGGGTTTTTTLGCYNCDDGFVIFSTGAVDYGQYPTRDVCSTSNECGLFIYNAVDRPNRFNVYDSTGLIANSGWVGYATWPGPWGSSLNVSPSGQFNYDFNSTSGRYVLVEYGPADPDSPNSDTAEWRMTCGTCGTTTTSTTTTTTTQAPTIRQYYVSAPSALIEYQNKFNATKQIQFTTNFTNNATICAYSGSITAVSGAISTLTDLGDCPGTNYQRIRSTNAASSKWYGYESSSGDWVQFFGSSPVSFDFNVCVTTGSVSLSSTNTSTSNLGACPTTTTTTTTTTLPPTSAILDWQFSETNGNGAMTLYINGNVVEVRTSNSNGTYTVYQGDVIYCEISAGGCSGGSNYANAYTLGIIADAACGIGSTSLTSNSYTVLSGDLGNTISLDMYASCDGGCV